MKNFTPCHSGYRNDFVKCAEKILTLKNLLKFFFLLSPLASLAGKPGFSLPHAATPIDSVAITETLRTNLYLLQPDGSTVLADGVFTIYNNLYHDSVTLEDAAKFTNILENFGLLRYGKTLAVERRPIIQENDTLFFKLWKTKQRAYQIEVVANMLTNEGLQAFFVDSYLNTQTPISLGDTTKINFSVNGDAGSSASDRFKIIFKPKPPYVPIPVIFTSLNASQQGEKIAVRWQVQNEMDVAKYEVEKSINGTEFSLVNTTNVSTANTVSGDYAWYDDKEISGSNFYRIKSISRNGSSNITQVIKVIASKTGASFIVFPNPVKGNTINLQIVDQVYGTYQLRLINSNGQVVYTNKLPVTSNSMLKSLTVDTNLPKGIYQLEIKNADKSTQVKTILVQ
jgi:hypothetical protein